MHKTATAYKPKSFSDIAPHATNFREQLPIKTLAHTVVAPPLKPQENINNNQGIIYDFSMWQSSSRIFGDSPYPPQGLTFATPITLTPPLQSFSDIDVPHSNVGTSHIVGLEMAEQQYWLHLHPPETILSVSGVIPLLENILNLPRI